MKNTDRKKGTPRRDGSGRGDRSNRGRGGCKPTKRQGQGKGVEKLFKLPT